MRKLKFHALSAGVTALAIGMASPSVAGPTINLTFTPGTTAQAMAGFQAAANAWTAIFTDNVTIDLTVGTAALGPGILGQAGSVRTAYTYSSFSSALALDKTSSVDDTAVANLPGGSSFGMLLNRTSNSPNGSGNATPFVDNDGDANNSIIRMTNANAKALGLTPTPGNLGGACSVVCDAFIQFSTNFSFDYDPSDGISPGLYDFVGVAMHEIGHALGFISGVDILDINSPPVNGPFSDNQFTYVAPLDMFRYSVLSTASGVIDWTADTRAKYFSVDGGATVGPQFSTGVNFGDGRQASHWKDNLGIGIMDPTAGTGEKLAIGANDLMALDAIGWDLPQIVPPAVPEPASWAMMIAGFALVGSGMRYRRRSVAVA